MRGAIHHIDLTVKDAHASRAFYESVLGFMGYRLADAHPNGYDFDLRDGDTFCSIGILSARDRIFDPRGAGGRLWRPLLWHLRHVPRRRFWPLLVQQGHAHARGRAIRRHPDPSCGHVGKAALRVNGSSR
jgi:catechol 2,3-dioxygenase-like lactoylglutathione lyase family enzyme